MNIHGAKKGGGKQRQPVIAPDSAQSKTFINIMYGLGEGEIAGLANGYKSIYLEDTPLQNDNGEFNFPNVKVDFRTGTNDQEYIDGFPDVASETAVGVELKHGTPYIKAFNNLDLDALRVRLKWGALRQQNRENGDVSGVKIDYAIDVKTDNGGWVEALNTSINAKTSDAYERSHRIDLPKAGVGWQLRVRRITPNSTSELISDKMYIAAISEVIDLKLRYPNTAVMGLRYDAESFSNVAKMSARCKGLIIKVPTNYDPVARTYTGMWDGQFKMAYSNNPAWVYYDLCTAERYGLGGRLTQSMIDKWSLYRLAQYCDEMVDDGMGGTEPRFSVNVYIQSADGAFELLSRLAGVFRAISYWDGNSIVLDADIPQDSIYSFSRANVIDGVFEYTGTRSRDRRTVVKVAWDNPANHFKTEYEYVRDEAAIAKFGVRVADIAAWGCTSRGQAQRAGLWALKSEQLETRMVTFKVGLDGLIPAPAKVIEISDELFAGRANGGRVLTINKTKTVITLDRAITANVGDTLVINGNDGISQRRQIKSVSGDKVTVTKPFGDIAVENVWVLDSQDLATMKFRVLSVTADENHQFTITAVQYNPAKYDAIDTGAYIDERPISVINPTVQAPTKAVNLSSYHTVNQGVSVTTLVISWEQAVGAVKYQVEWRKDNGNWQALPPTGINSIEVTGVYAGTYEAKVTAISAFGQASLATTSQITQIANKQTKPPRLVSLTAQGKLFGMDLSWEFSQGSDDTNYTEVQVSAGGSSPITTLGTFAYPTNTHEITGLQGNLHQFYRGRIVDKLGNASDWTNWVSGITSANPSQILSLLGNQIGESHLDQALRAPIGKIPSIESSIGTINGKIPSIENSIISINGKIPTIEQSVQGISTQLPQINRAIAQATQKAGDVQTQARREIDELSRGTTQKFSQVNDGIRQATDSINAYKVSNNQALSAVLNKAASAFDTATSHSTQINALQSSLSSMQGNLASKADAMQIEQIDSKVGVIDGKLTAQTQQVNSLTASLNDAITSDNVITDTQAKSSTEYLLGEWGLSRQIDNGKKVLVSISTNPVSTVALYNSSTSRASYIDDIIADGTPKQITWNAGNGNNSTLYVYRTNRYDSTQTTTSNVSVRELQSVASMTANINEVKQSITDKERSLAERITSIDSAYKAADAQTASKIGQVERSISDKNQALALAQSKLNARFDNLSVGARNLLLATATPLNLSAGNNSNYGLSYRASESLIADETYTFSADVEITTGSADVVTVFAHPTTSAIHLPIVNGKIKCSFTAVRSGIPNVWIYAGRSGSTRGNALTISRAKLEKGTVATDWTPAPEDLQVDLSPYATNASLDEFKRTQATKDTATTQKLSQLESGLGTKANATALNNYYTKAQTDQAIGGRVERFEASLRRQELNAVTDLNTLTTQGQYFIKAGNNRNAPATSWLFVDVETSNDQWIIMQTVRQDNNAKNQWVRQRHNGNWSAWEKVATGSELNDKASASALNELNTRVTQVDGKITAEANKVSQLQTTLNGQTTSIRNVEQSVNGVRAIKAVTVDNNGFISGYGLMSELQNGRVTSRFGINADQIYLGATTSAKKPFVLNTRPTTIDGVNYPAGAWFNTAHIANASITNAHLADATITSAKIANGSIDNAKIANGAITSAKIGKAQIGTLQIAGESVTVPRAQSFDDARPNLLGEIFNMSMDAQGGSILITVHFDVNCTLTRSSRGNGYASVTSSMEKKLKISIRCNGSIVTEKIFTLKDIRESTATDNSSSGNRPVTATATSFVYDKPMAIINHVHRNPPSPANYTISIEHVSGDGDHTVMSGSSLLLGVKR